MARKNYIYQVLGYMWLTGTKTGELNYCLVNTPEALVNDELYRLSFKFGDDEVENFKPNYTFDDIEPAKRLKRFSFDYDEAAIEELKTRIIAAREYLNSLSL